MTSNDEYHRDRQMVMGNIRQPQRLRLGMESTQERQYCCPGSLGSPKHVSCCIWVLGIHAPVPCEEWLQACGMWLNGEEVVPTHMLSTRFGDSYVNQVSCP